MLAQRICKRQERKDVGLVSHGWLREEDGPIKILWLTVLVLQEKDLKGGRRSQPEIKVT